MQFTSEITPNKPVFHVCDAPDKKKTKTQQADNRITQAKTNKQRATCNYIYFTFACLSACPCVCLSVSDMHVYIFEVVDVNYFLYNECNKTINVEAKPLRGGNMKIRRSDRKTGKKVCRRIKFSKRKPET